jgi:hypothetical protein
MSRWQIYARESITVRDMPYIVRHLHAPIPFLRLFRELSPTATLSRRMGAKQPNVIHSFSYLCVSALTSASSAGQVEVTQQN